MKVFKTLAIVAGLSALTLSCVAQEEEEAPLYIYATYFYCGGGPLDRVDELTAETAPIMDGLVEDGTISGWGWYAHHTGGGGWQRLSYHTASSMEELIDGSDAIQAALQAADNEDEADDEQPSFGQLCYRHDDYIWEGVTGSQPSDESPTAGFSTYHVCDFAGEDRADEIIKEHERRWSLPQVADDDWSRSQDRARSASRSNRSHLCGGYRWRRIERNMWQPRRLHVGHYSLVDSEHSKAKNESRASPGSFVSM
jgi:hypothetical protein